MAGSQAQSAVEVRQLFHLDEFADCGRDCSARSGASPICELLPVALPGCGSQSRRPRLRRLRWRRAWSASASPSPASSRMRMPYLHSHMLGVLPEYRNFADRPAAETAPARGCPRARHRTHRVDLRSAGTQERVLQHRKTGRHRAPLPPQPVRHHHQPVPRRSAHRSLLCRMVAGAPRPAGAAWRTRPLSASPTPRTSPTIRANDPDAARAIQAENAQLFQDAFARGLRRHRLSTAPKPKAPTCWSRGSENPRRRDAEQDTRACFPSRRLSVSASNPPPRSPPMKLDRITLRQIRMPLVHFFETSFCRTYSPRHRSGGSDRRTASPAGAKSPPARTPSTTKSGPHPPGSSCTITLRRACSSRRSESPNDVFPLTAHIRGHNMARGGLEAAVWDLFEARQYSEPAVEDRSAAAPDARSPAASRSAFRIPWTQLFEKIEHRTRRRLPAHQDQDQARAGMSMWSAACASASPTSSSWPTPTPPTRWPTPTTSSKLDDFYLMMIEQPLGP